MSKGGLRFTEEAWRQIAERNSRWQRGTLLPIVGEANAKDEQIRRTQCLASSVPGRPTTPDESAQDETQSRRVASPRGGLVGKVSQADSRERPAPIPVLTDAVAGPGAQKRPYKRRKASPVPYFQHLTALLRPLGIPDPTPELRFAPPRFWRFDFAWPAPVKLALEIQGGLFIEGRHNRGAAMIAEYAKHNAGVLAGWRILYFSPSQLADAANAVRVIFGR